MRINGRERTERGRERITLVPESLDDLWHLQYILEPSDRVSGQTSRRIQRDDDRLRDTGGEREHMFVVISVESVEFHKFANRLRIGGEIVECSREDQLGFHHTLNVEVHDEISIEKRFERDQEQRLSEAVEATDNPDVIIVTVEEGHAAVYEVTQYGTEERASISGPTGKGEYARARTELFDELVSVLRRIDADAYLLAGPGFTKQDALSTIEESLPSVAQRITTVDTAAGGERGVHEVLKRGVLEDVQHDARIAEEAEFIDELTRRIATGEAVTYGPGDVKQAVDYGAVERLLVLDDRLRAERAGEGFWAFDVNELIRSVEHQGGAVTVFSSEFPPGKQLEQFGGIAALLRYRID